MKHYDFEISLFVDGELAEEDKEKLFAHMAACKECRNTFEEYLRLKEKSKDFFIQKMDKLKNKDAGKNKFYKISFYASAAAAVILIMLLAGGKERTAYIAKTEVKYDTVYVSEKSESAGQIKKLPAPQAVKKKETSKQDEDSKIIEYVMSLPSEKITEADLVKQENGSM
jgi:hypothetical protein